MDFKQIQYFTEVVNHGSFSKAAEHLFLSQPNISKSIKDLEKELDVKLLTRTTRKIELTDTGKLLYQYSQRISQSIEHFYDELDDIKNSKKGNIKMGIFSTLGTDIFSELMALFHKEYPLITVRFVEDGALHLKNTLLQGELDLVVMPLPIDDEFESIPFMKGNLCLVVHQNHRLSDQETVMWEDLKEESFIIFREGYQVHELIMQACKLNGFEPNVICETSQWKFIMEMVSFNQGITILPQSDLEQIDVSEGKIKVIHLNPSINWQIGIAWKKDSYLSYATRTWIDFIKTKLEGSRNDQ
ncbi:LysR family transcriptional regulator [Bacillus sp. ISL-4]|uniref:LysR family transcriptional regulator n=1 Tax=Bacillus sp. ISL-4 TaxID=2819125 RepID=UPI001BEC24D0|nr:LysR family transcriptional regulator [Bacillus sp. ISL-4]MBT2668544.1 LysR family transcriptional regulator [Bacillus sp. ISL-4]MBT2674532.1 LysR family transcriptional regulator [Streptomyces sp. ISL-14]